MKKNFFKKENFADFLGSLNDGECKMLWAFMLPFISVITFFRYIKEHKKQVASIFIAVLLTATMTLFICDLRSAALEQERRVDEAKENVEYITIVAGSRVGEYHTWWEIACEFCPDFMVVHNFRTDNRNYLNYLYEVNGGKHLLREGEAVLVPILE
jgi:hypothetical protein